MIPLASQIIFRNQFNAEKSRNGSTYWFGADMSGLGADSDMYVVIDQFGIVEYKEAKEADTFILNITSLRKGTKNAKDLGDFCLSALCTMAKISLVSTRLLSISMKAWETDGLPMTLMK